jgi:sec-independent protein translocase protein TatA
MLSIPDMALLGAAALMLFGPDQLPKVARRAGSVMREIQNTSHAFLREMERAADVAPPPPPRSDPAPAGSYTDVAPAPFSEAYAPYEPARPEPSRHAVDPYGEPEAATPAHGVDPYGDPQPSVAEKLAEPRPAIDLEVASQAAQAAPQADHPAHV